MSGPMLSHMCDVAIQYYSPRDTVRVVSLPELGAPAPPRAPRAAARGPRPAPAARARVAAWGWGALGGGAPPPGCGRV